MSMPIPRFRGNAFEKDGGWAFEFHISMLGDDDGINVISNNIYK